MKRRVWIIAIAAVVGLALSTVIATPAQASPGGSYLRTGDVVCTNQVLSTSVRFTAIITNGSGTATIRAASSANGPESVVFSRTGFNIDVNQTYTTPVPTYLRGCVTVTAHFANTWIKQFLYVQAPGGSAAGPYTATISPGAWACGNNGLGPVRLRGSASGAATWFLFGSDLDYAFVGMVFSIGGTSVDATFTPGPELSLVEFCVRNTGTTPLSASFLLLEL